MATKRRNLFLYLTLACFVALIAMFIVDGYMGIYDTLYITAGEREEKVEPDFWMRPDRVWTTGVSWGGEAFFRYEVDNRRFATYSVDTEVSIWQNQEKLRDLVSQQLQIAAFDRGQLEWVLDTTELEPEGISSEQRYEYTILIKRGEIERKIIVYINSLAYPPKPVPIR